MKTVWSECEALNRNGDRGKVDMSSDSILIIIPAKDHDFVQTKGSTSSVLKSDL